MSARAEMPQEILELLRGSDGPLTAKQIAQKAFGSASSKDIETAAAALDGLKSRGEIFEFPPERDGYGARFGVVSPTEWLAQRIVSTVKEAGGRVTLRGVRGSLRKWETRYFDEALGKLVTEGRLFYLTVRYKYVLTSPPDPCDHLLPRQVTALREILERINRHRKNALTIAELKTFLNGSDTAKILHIEHAGQPSEDLLREWYHRDLSRRGGLTSVPIPWTWLHYESWCNANSTKPGLAEFQDFMWQLHRDGKIELISHSMTQPLSERESEVSLRGRHGEVLYYWKWR